MAGERLQEQQQIVRIPLYAHEDQRQQNAQTQQSRTMQDQFLVNCYPVLSKNPLSPDKPIAHVQQRMGWYSPEGAVSASGQITNLTTAYPVAILNMTQLSNTLIVAYVDGSNFRFCAYKPGTSIVSLGTVAFTAKLTAASIVHLSELTIGGVPMCGVVISDPNSTGSGASAGYYISSSGGTMAAGVNVISDSDYPPNLTTPRKAVGPLVQLNNVVYQMTEEGYIHGTEVSTAGLSQITVWNSLGVTQATSYPDRGLGLCRYKHHLVAFGEETIEFFNDEGKAPPALPIQRTEQAFIKFGTISQKSFLNVDDTLWFVGKSVSGNVNLYRLEGYTPVPIAQPPQARLVQNRPYTIDLQATNMHSMKHLVLNCWVLGGPWFTDGVNTGDIPNNASNVVANLCYCIDTNSWWGWATEHQYVGTEFEKMFFTTIFSAQTVTRVRFVNSKVGGGSPFTYGLHPQYLIGYSEGASGQGYDDAYRVSDSASLDYWRIPVMIATNWYDFGTFNRKFIRSVRIIGDHIKNYNPGGQPWTAFNSEGLTLTLGFSRTDGLSDNANPEIIRSKPLLTQTLDYYHFPNFGACRKGRFWILINSYVPVRLEALELQIAQGTH